MSAAKPRMRMLEILVVCMCVQMRRMSKFCVRGWHRRRVAKLSSYTVGLFI